jgi:hypothetical protein
MYGYDATYAGPRGPWCICGTHPVLPDLTLHRRFWTRRGAERTLRRLGPWLVERGWTLAVTRHRRAAR